VAIALLLLAFSGVLLVAALLAGAWKYLVAVVVGTVLLMLAGKIQERIERRHLSSSKRP
jgi:hypothetical protein